MNKAELEAAIGTMDTLIQIFAVLVAIGIVGEVGFGVRHWILGTRLHKIQHAEDLQQQGAIAALNKEAGDARKQAGEAIERAAKAEENLGNARKSAALAEEHAAEANKTAEEERIARIKLQAKLKGRRLTAEQKSKLTSLLGPFMPTPITLEWVSSGGQEAADLASDFNDAILSAGIPMTTANRNILMDQSFRGVLLKVGDDRHSEGEAIAGFLIAIGLSTSPVGTLTPSNAQQLAIVIGASPPIE